jgi:hypothetical protein
MSVWKFGKAGTVLVRVPVPGAQKKTYCTTVRHVTGGYYRYGRKLRIESSQNVVQYQYLVATTRNNRRIVYLTRYRIIVKCLIYYKTTITIEEYTSNKK